MWGEPLNAEEFKELFSEGVEEKKIGLKTEPNSLYDVVKAMCKNSEVYSRLCLASKIREIDNINIEKLKEQIINEIKKLIEKPVNIQILLLGTQNCFITLESSGDKLLEFMNNLNKLIKKNESIQEKTNVLCFVEDVFF